MPIFSPRRFQEPWLPLRRDPFPARLLAAVERWIKGWLFGCRMCGNCIIQETMFVCPMTCPKGLRNGLCGEAGADHCVVDETRPCTWFIIYERAKKAGKLDKLLEINAPLDGARAGHEAWYSLLRFWFGRKQGPSLPDMIMDRQKFDQEYEKLLFELRQPDWWQGDAVYHAPAYDKPVSLLEANLRERPFVTTAEIEAPLDNSPAEVAAKVNLLRDYVVSVNFADNAFAASRMSSTAGCKLCIDEGFEAVMQIQARDRSRVLVESDVIGAAGLGVQNILCLGGNYFDCGMQPISKPDQYDLDVVQMLWILRRMRDEGKLLDGRELEKPPRFFLGAASSPFAAVPEYVAVRVEKKVNAGAQFIQTQMIFDHGRFMDWLEALDRRSLLGKVYVLASVMPLRGFEEARSFVGGAGHSMPLEVVQRMERAYEKDLECGGRQFQIEEGVTIALDMLEKLKKTPGIKGVHLMSGGQEEIVPGLVREAQLPPHVSQ